MFRPSGLFADVKCPSTGHGHCERPHCFYKHGSRQRNVSVAASSQPSAVSSAEVQNCYQSFVCGSPASDDTTDDNIQELLRINKEIEAVRHEVEQEQRRLSHYQTIRSGSRNTVSKSETTADLRSYSSSSKEQKVKNAQVINGERETVLSDQKKPVAQAPFSQKPSPGLLEEPIEDSVLIIDIPSSPDQTRGQSQKLDCVAGSAQGSVEQLKEKVPIALDSPLLRLAEAEAYQVTSPRVSCNIPGASRTSFRQQPVSKSELFIDIGQLAFDEQSSEEEQELNYSDMELSDSDPMEECYRIFMEANNEDKGNKEQPDVSVAAMEVDKVELTNRPQTLLGKKRVAHEAKHAEQPLAKSRPQAKILIPLREPAASGSGSQSSISSKIRPAQQRASSVTASVKGAQAFASFSSQKKPETQTTACPPQTPANIQPAPVQNAYINYLPLGTPVIQLGSNLHLILPEGTFPLSVTSGSCPLSSLLTPVTPVHMSTMKQTCHKAAVTPVQRYHLTAPMLIPAPTRKTSLAHATAHLHPAASTTPQPTAAAKPLPTKRKLKQQSGATKDKVPYDVRQRYVNMFTEEFLKTTANLNEAFEKAVAEEETVYNRSANKLKYLSIAVNSLKRLKKQSCVSSKDENEVKGQRSKGNIPFNLELFQANDDVALYESLKDYILTERRLIGCNYPVQHPEKAGSAALFTDNKKGSTDPLKRICCRCGATYSVCLTGKHIRKEECNYHYGKVVRNKVPGGVETRYSCCQGVMGAPGCQVFKLHVHDAISMDGFVSTKPRHPMDTSCPGVYSLNCEMCYTVHGLELSRVTVVNSSLQVIYDSFVRPDHEVIDYNTRFSGIGEEDVKGNYTSLREVQETLQSFISADTILIGHGLEADLCGLKLLHGTVVDISLVFPHRLGPPHKLTLNTLTAEYLLRIIQESVCGHDTGDDAAACMELMIWKLKESGKLKK
ncbi:unnamed protein product [Pleuronectes platessa]|uniref:Exonuclease domain-containing protein n=1 Tax=Pleuronectes platessa TaxID=8262 RepID=A0A9N7U9I6_PLEPL|nr:unnamed protein product [Pleuronectes platessa]